MTATGFDHYGGQGLDGYAFTVELDVALAFEDQVDFRHLLVVVGFGILLDIDKVERGDGVVVVHESPAGEAARTGGGLDFGEVGDLVALAHFKGYFFGKAIVWTIKWTAMQLGSSSF